jgi:AcrR family transcriptional regulator
VKRPAQKLVEEVAEITGRDRQRQETRRRLLDAALSIFRRDGFVNARIVDIAEVADLSHGSFYFHFPTKEDVLLEVLDGAEQRIAAAVSALPATAKLSAVLEAVCERMAAEWESEPQLFPHVGAVGIRRAAETREGHKAPLRAALGQRFAAAAERRELAAHLAAPLLADLFLVNLFAGALAWCAHPKVPLGSVLGTVVELFLDGARRQRR